VESYRGGLFKYGLSNSLKAIRAARSRLHLLTARSPNRAVLASQIELCDLMLDEILSISCSLEQRVNARSATSRSSVTNRRTRSGRYPVVPQHDRPNRSINRKSAPTRAQAGPGVTKSALPDDRV